MNNKVVLLHGFMRDYRDMKPLKKNLAMLGYEGILVNLPLTYKRLNHSVSLLENTLEERLINLKGQEKIHLVGHSTGGLVIRSWLAKSKYRSKVDKCVLLATPNQGSELADIAGKYFGLLPTICKTLESLQSYHVRKLPGLSNLSVEVGALAGNKNNLLLGNLLKGENDGRVTVESVWLTGLKDFMILPFGHLDIHKEFRTAQHIAWFLKTGNFKKVGSG
ncbi:alpha/beta fold hydrolase [Desulfotomaculum defluvii]